MHQYLDSDGSGTSTVCVSPTIGAERISTATEWLKEHNLKGFLGEMGAGSNPDCISAVSGALCHMQRSDVWIGAHIFEKPLSRTNLMKKTGFAWWAAGPWWGNVSSMLAISGSICAHRYASTSNLSSPLMAQLSRKCIPRPSSHTYKCNHREALGRESCFYLNINVC